MKHLIVWALKSLLRMALLLFLVSILAFALVSLSPVDPLQANVGQAAMGAMSPEQLERLRAYWGEGQPVVQRYLAWAGDMLRGDFGTSLLYRRSVLSVIGEKSLQSLGILLTAWLFSGFFGYALGLLSAAKEGSLLDRGVRTYALWMASTPAFWIALVLLMIFAVWLGVLPIGLSAPIGLAAGEVTFLDRVRHGLLPALTLSLTGLSSVALHTRAKALEVLHSEYALFARARGESDMGIVRRHGIRNTLLPALTLQLGSIGELLGGSVLVEQVFSYPGLGQATVAAGLGGDVPLLMGITMLSAALVFLGNFAADLLYGLVDPRMRRRRTGWA